MNIVNKKTFQYVKLENCVENELFMVETIDGRPSISILGIKKVLRII